MEDHPHHSARRALKHTTARSIAADNGTLEVTPGPAASPTARQTRKVCAWEAPDICGHLQDSTVSAWSVILSTSNSRTRDIGVAWC
jgi:hypothetical protein